VVIFQLLFSHDAHRSFRRFPLPCPATVDTVPTGHNSPPIRIGDYVQRFVKFADPGFEGMVLALVLTERLTNKVGP
jgi:hypothetical protein